MLITSEPHRCSIRIEITFTSQCRVTSCTALTYSDIITTLTTWTLHAPEKEGILTTSTTASMCQLSSSSEMFESTMSGIWKCLIGTQVLFCYDNKLLCINVTDKSISSSLNMSNSYTVLASIPPDHTDHFHFHFYLYDDHAGRNVLY